MEHLFLVLLLLILKENGRHDHIGFQSEREFEVFVACNFLASNESVLPFALNANRLTIRDTLGIELLQLQRDKLVLWLRRANQS